MYFSPNFPTAVFSFVFFIDKHFISFQRGFVNLPRKWRSQWPLAIPEGPRGRGGVGPRGRGRSRAEG
jgi:hypothetical protein